MAETSIPITSRESEIVIQTSPQPSRNLEQHLAFVFGVVFVVALLFLAIAVPSPTSFQYTVFRVVLALATAGVAATISGFLQLTIADWVRASGALAVFVVVFFYNPAALLVQKSSPDPIEVFSKENVSRSAPVRAPKASSQAVKTSGEVALSTDRSEPVAPSPEFSGKKTGKSVGPIQHVVYRVNLLIPTSMSSAVVLLDDRQAKILRRTATLITIEVPASDLNHQFRLVKDGIAACAATTAIVEDDVTLTPCQP